MYENRRTSSRSRNPSKKVIENDDVTQETHHLWISTNENIISIIPEEKIESARNSPKTVACYQETRRARRQEKTPVVKRKKYSEAKDREDIIRHNIDSTSPKKIKKSAPMKTSVRQLLMKMLE